MTEEKDAKKRTGAEVIEIRDGLRFLSENFKAMTDWEKQFYNSIRVRNPYYFSDRVMDKLRQIVKRLCK